jgi:hypothetical protein
MRPCRDQERQDGDALQVSRVFGGLPLMKAQFARRWLHCSGGGGGGQSVLSSAPSAPSATTVV